MGRNIDKIDIEFCPSQNESGNVKYLRMRKSGKNG